MIVTTDNQLNIRIRKSFLSYLDAAAGCYHMVR